MKKILMTFLLVFSFNTSILAYSESIILGGENIGIKVNTKGILVIGFYKVNDKFINKNNLKIGDYIISINGEKIESLEDFTKLINKHIKENKVNITVLRNNKTKDVTLELTESDGVYKTGLYVKDSLTGIGTITYIDPETGVFGALGHEIVNWRSITK